MNKKEIKRTAVRRRGTTLAAAALSIAMVGPFVHAVTPASPFAAVANAQENQPDAEAPAAGGDKDKAIYSPGQADQKGTISGSVKEIVEAKVGFGDVQDSGNPLEGVKVYAQWYEGENTQHSSPVYYTESDANGNFTIKMGPYTDALGKTRHFDADASAGLTTGDDRGKRDQKREKIRVWTELPENMTDKYRLVHQPAAGIFPGIGANTTPTTQGDGVWGGHKITGMTIQYAQKDKLPQHLPENKWAESTGAGGNGGTYAGRAFWNLDVLQGAKNHNTVSAFGGKDLPAPGMKVVGSYLTDDAVNKIEAYAKNNFAGKTLRGKGWTPADEQGLQKWINEQIAADPEGWIAETMTTTTGADGTFELRWKGLYGYDHKTRGLVPEDKFGKLAGSHGEGKWALPWKDSKHVNMHWSYVSILGKDGKPLPNNIGVLYPWSLGQWAGPGFGSDLKAGANAQLFGGDGAFIGNTTSGYTGWNIALAPQALKFDVVDKNTTDNWAKLGDKVQTYTAGLPISDDLNYYIEWFDKGGNSVKKCDAVKADSATEIPSCEFEVPADAQTGDTFTARLKVADGEPDPKNDLVLALDAFAVSRDYLEYKPVDAKADEKATSEPKFDNPETEPEETKPEKAKFELGKLPEGVKEDQVKVDPETGVVTFKPTADQAGKAFKFPVIMRNEELKVPVLDENGDPVKDDEGNPKTQGRIVARADATFDVEAAKTSVDDSDVKTVDPTDDPQDSGIKVENKDDDTKVSAKDEDGKDVPVEIDEDGKVIVTPGEDVDGPINVTIEDPDLPDGKVEVEVPVKDHEKDRDDNNSDKKPESPVVTPGESTTVPADGGEHPVGKVENPKGDETGKLVDKDGNEIPGSKVEIDENGNVKVTVPEGTDPQDGKVVITDGEGNPVGEIDVKIVDPDTDAGNNVPNYGDRKNVEAGASEQSDPFEGKTDVPVKDATGKPSEGAEDWTFDTAKDSGVVTATAPTYEKVGEKIDSKLPEIDSSWEKFKEIFTPYVRPSVEVDFTYEDDSKNSATAGFDLVGKDGKSLLDPDGDFDGDGTSNKEEIEKGTNPADENSKPGTESEGPSIDKGSKIDEVPADGESKKLDDKVKNPTDGMNGEVIGEDGNPIKDATVEIDPNTGEITVTVPKGTDPQDATVVVKDKDKNKVGEIDIKITEPEGNGSSDGSGSSDLSSKPNQRCINTGLGVGIPLLFLIPVGLASQMNIPGLSDFVAPINKQIRDLNTQLQKQAGVFNGPLAGKMAGIDAQLKRFGVDHQQAAGAVALIAAGALAIGLIADACAPGGGSSNGSSK